MCVHAFMMWLGQISNANIKIWQLRHLRRFFLIWKYFSYKYKTLFTNYRAFLSFLDEILDRKINTPTLQYFDFVITVTGGMNVPLIFSGIKKINISKLKNLRNILYKCTETKMLMNWKSFQRFSCKELIGGGRYPYFF